MGYWDGDVYALDAEMGKGLWRFKLGEPRDKVPLPLLLALQTE